MGGRRLDRESGQTSVEYVAVGLLVALLLGGGVAAASGLGARSGIGDGVRRQFARALCVVTGGGATCAADREACLVSSDAQESGWSIQTVLRVDHKKALVVEELSDKTYRVTRVGDWAGGLNFLQGGEFNLKIGARNLLVSDEAQAAVLAHFGDTSSWTLHSRRDTDALVDALKEGRPHRDPDTHADDRGWSVTLHATVARDGGEADLELSAKDIYGSSLDRRTGQRTIYVRPSREAQATLTLSALEGKGTAGGSELYGVTLDRSGRPIEISVMRSGGFHAAVDLPQDVQDAVGHLRARPGAVPTSTGREYVEESRLALTSAEDRRVAATFIDQVVHPDVIHTGSPVDVSRALRDRIAATGMINARVYAVDEGGFEVEGRFGERGLGVGGSVNDETRKLRLIAATSRGPDGVWYRREDCLRAARS